MIERKVIDRKLKELQVKEYMSNILDKPGYSHLEIHRTPLGERITVYTSKPGLIVGRKGSIIKDLTEVLKRKFNLENPQIEICEISTPYLNPDYVAKNIVHTFERFGPSRFKYLGHKLLESIMEAGALGAEIVISGRGVPSKRAKSWRFSAGHLKKSGDIAVNYVKKGCSVAQLKSGAVGVKVSILTPDIKLPDEIMFKKINRVHETQVESIQKIDTEEEIKQKEQEKVDVKKKSRKKKEEPEEKTEKQKTKKKESKEVQQESIKEEKETKEDKRKVITAEELEENVPSMLDLADKKWQ